MLILSSPDFDHGGTLPDRFTCVGQDVSPAFRWSGAPPATREFVLVCTDPDAPDGPFHHWAVRGIAAVRNFLRAGVGPVTMAPGFLQAMNDFGHAGYGGPCPPPGDRPHGYHFRLLALSAPLSGAGARAGCAEIIRLARPLELSTAEIVGFFARP